MTETIQVRQWALDPKTFQVVPEDGEPVGMLTAQEWRAQQWPTCPICGEVGEPDRQDAREFGDRFAKFMIGAWECPNDCDPRGPRP